MAKFIGGIEKKENIGQLEEKSKKGILQKNVKTVKDLIAPAGIDATHTNHLEIISNKTKYARSVIVSTIPRMCTFPSFLRSMYTFGDANVSVFIRPVGENTSQTELNRRINEIESEVSGKITQICVEDGQSVEYGQVLMYVE